MSEQEINDGDVPRLELCWEDTPFGVRWGPAIGETIGSVFRIGLVRNLLLELHGEMQELGDEVDVERAACMLAFNLEAFYSRAYETRDRVVSLLRGYDKDFEWTVLADPSTRVALINSTPLVPREILECAGAVLERLQPHTEIRNRHTHKRYVRLMWRAEGGAWDAEDVAVDFMPPQFAGRFQHELRAAIEKMAIDYVIEANAVINLVGKLAVATEYGGATHSTALGA